VTAADRPPFDPSALPASSEPAAAKAAAYAGEVAEPRVRVCEERVDRVRVTRPVSL